MIISLTWLCYQTHDGATIFSGAAFTRGPAPGRVVELCATPEWPLCATLRDIHIATTARENGRRAAELASRYQTVHNKNKRLDLPKTSAVARE